MNFDVNLLAVIATTIVFMIVGTLWYGPLFGKKWMKLIKMTPESMKKGSRVVPMIFVLITAVIMSFVLAVVLKSLLITTVVPGLIAAFVLWFGFIATTLLNRVLFEKSSVSLYLLNALQCLAALLLGSLVLTLWPW